MPTPIEQLLSRTVYATDGVTTVWNFSFSGGYLDPSHVSAYTTAPDGIQTPLSIVPGTDLIGPYQLQITPALVAGNTLTIHRDTPKDLPLVDFADESGFSEIALDTNAKQAVFIAAETVDTVNSFNASAAVEAANAAGAASAEAAGSAAAAGVSAIAAASSAVAAASSAITAAAPTGAFAASLAAPSGSSLVGYLPAGTGAVPRTAQNKLRESISVQDFGAVGDGVTNDTAAIQAAMTASAGKELNFGGGYTYLINAEIAGVSNVEIVGHSTIKAVTRIRSYLYFDNQTNIRITGLLFDLGQSILSTYTSADYAAAVYAASHYNQAVYCYQSSKIYIRDCQFNNLYTAALFFYQCSDVIDVIGNRFESPLQAQDQNANHVMFQTCSAWITVQNNKIRNAYPSTGVRYGVAGVFTSGLTGTLDVCNNLFIYCGRNSVGGHQLGAYSSYGDVAQGTIRNNIFLLSNQQVIRLSTCHHMDVYGNYCTMNALAGGDDQMVSIEGTTSLGGAPFGCDDIKVHHNTFQDDYASNRIGVFAGAYDWGYQLKDITISDNLFIGMKWAVRLSGPYNRLRVERNNMLGINGNIIDYDIAVVTPASTYGLQSNAVMKNLSIQGNIIDSTSGPAAVPIHLIFTGFTGSIQESTISDNRIISGTGNAASAILYRGVASGDLRITNNYITGFALPLDAATGSTLLFADNTCRAWTAALPTSTSSWTTASFTNNSYSTGARSGTARLVAGTVIVTTPEVLTGDVISVMRTAVDGSALGHLSQPSIVTKTSFVINSSAPTESNFVAWEIIH